MSEHPEPRPVIGRPPVEGTEDELDAWVEGFLDAILGPEEPDPLGQETSSC